MGWGGGQSPPPDVQGAQPDGDDVTLQYVVTYGERELFCGERTAGGACGLGGVLTGIFDDHRLQVAQVSGGSGGSLRERYNAFAAKGALIKVTATSADGEAQNTVAVTLGTAASALGESGRTAVRYHLDPVDYCRNVDYRMRIKRLCQHYNGKMMVVFEKMLAAAHGYEDKLLAALIEHYGPEPARTATASGYQARLTALYEKYNPAQVQCVPALLQQYSGSEDELLAALVAKYGAEPTLPLAPRPLPKRTLDYTSLVERFGTAPQGRSDPRGGPSITAPGRPGMARGEHLRVRPLPPSPLNPGVAPFVASASGPDQTESMGELVPRLYRSGRAL
eukprot:TRINITY_DN10738_c0_g1_i1.p1 TRINITY_DN10738_c0_g1~~TRINITY_DN10738_c0_g1_i1.p1  ORF type:complete len:335 (+),score=50.95 TRINITY_DN10738_c0_g1_i1:82-1086(+)